MTVFVNVLAEGVEIQDGVYQLRRFLPGKQYIDPVKGRRISSIGRREVGGQTLIFAAVDQRFNGDPNYECLFVL